MDTIPTRYGALLAPQGGPGDGLDGDGDLIGGFLRRYGEWGWLETCFVSSILPDRPRVLDGGAFLGTFGLGLSRLRPLAGLCAVEANPAVLPCLAGNLRLAGCPTALVDGLLAAPGASPWGGAAPGGQASAASWVPGAEGTPVAAPPRTVTLEGLRRLFGPFDLVKLDLEGMEAAVLRGDAAYLCGGGTAIWAECNEDRGSLDLCALLLSWGLPVHYFAAPAWTPDNHAGDGTPGLPWSYEAGLLAAPRQPPSLSVEMLRHGCILRPVRSVDDLMEALWHTPRWGMPDWPLDDPPALAALAGRTLRCQARDTFLQSDAPLGSRENEFMWQRLVAAEARARAAEARLAGLGQPLPKT